MDDANRAMTVADVGTLLWSILNDQAVDYSQYQWPRESARWHELVFCLLHELAGEAISTEAVRQATRVLVTLHLLDLDSLVAVEDDGVAATSDDPDVELMSLVLRRFGFSDEGAFAAVKTVREAAASVWNSHSGRLQRYLRHYGELMLSEIGQHFAFTDLSEDSRRRAFSHWLQNVLDMPISVSTTSVLQFCERLDITLDELVGAADVQDINLAIVDDLIEAYTANRELAALEAAFGGNA